MLPEILQWTVIIQLKIQVLFWAMPLRRPLVTRRESGATEAVFCRWMKHLSVRSGSFRKTLSCVRWRIYDRPRGIYGYGDGEGIFFYAISYTAGMNLHIRVLSGGNNHHMIEAMFKAFAKALDQATVIDPRITDILSTKGSL